MGCGVYDGVRFSMLTLIWCIIGATIILTVVFRGKRWLRFIGVLAMLGVAQFAWLGVETSARLARDIVRRDGGALVDDFDHGAMAARDAAQGMKPFYWAAALGLAVLALVPVKPRQGSSSEHVI